MTLATDILSLDQAAFGAAFRKSPMKRAKLRGLKQNAVVVLGNTGRADYVDDLAHTPVDADPPVSEHTARTGAPDNTIMLPP